MTTAIIAAFAAALAALLILRMWKGDGKTADAARLDDTGQAILAFGQAYPALPIRDVVVTADKTSAFVRLVDGRAGLVQATRAHSVCRVIDGESVRTGTGAGTKSLELNFSDPRLRSGRYDFASAADAAEVSLWLVGTLLRTSDDARPPGGGDGAD